MYMHCHLSSCVREFGPLHTYWLFPFERYNGSLESQPINYCAVELQLIRRFQNDNLIRCFQNDNFHLHQWPNAHHFLQALPDLPYNPILSVSL